jgi:hypothetical protein
MYPDDVWVGEVLQPPELTDRRLAGRWSRAKQFHRPRLPGLFIDGDVCLAAGSPSYSFAQPIPAADTSL